MALTIKINEFEGPFDVLLHLIEKDEMDIYNIQIHQITTEYIAYIETMKQIDMVIAAEFIVMASMLLEIKSKMLLPDHQIETFDFDNEEDPRYELISKLMEYKKYKELGKKIMKRQLEKSLVFTDLGQIYSDPDMFKEDYQNMKYDVQLLTKAFEAMLINLKRFDQEKLDYFTRIKRERFSLETKVTELRDYFNVSRKVTFSALFDGQKFIEEFITTFLAVLEILKSEKIHVVQQQQFDEILLISEA
jgi:segregation and condensation protein A